MNCPCIPCTARYQGLAPILNVKKTRAAEIPGDVWRLIFNLLDLNSRLACSITCKKWRYFISKSPLLHPFYNIGTFQCFKAFHKEFLKSRHFILLDTTASMAGAEIENGTRIIRKLIDYIEPVIKTRGVHVGTWNDKLLIKHVKTEKDIINFFSNKSLWSGQNAFVVLSKVIHEKLEKLKSIPTQVHVITDMELMNSIPFFSYSYQAKVTFHFYNVVRPLTPASLSNSIHTIENRETEIDPVEPKNKKQKKKNPVEICIHPLPISPPSPPSPKNWARKKTGVKKPHVYSGMFGGLHGAYSSIVIPPKK